ncbi:hypothetical protein Tdes44962_MAKER01236 [Teratosphaeria destructans]|uniref:Bladder cancer-related BC10-like protein n=1 Tax=Teratosphaeria destructans TaxID=418781 RepID=A0A9W7W720_9PEZI|nr:hypothetical protein Tdes44962_MAKER01236 [Teratosphaeria destructans]
MFCLRSWIPLLIFLTNASPFYILLFLTATYALQRPCVYCSILLFVLVFSLFDFHADWFAPRLQQNAKAPLTSVTEALSGFISGNATITDAVLESASLAISAVNGTRGSLASAAMEAVRRRGGGSGTVVGGEGNNTTASGFEALRGLLEKKQVRIPCVDVIVRL